MVSHILVATESYTISFPTIEPPLFFGQIIFTEHTHTKNRTSGQIVKNQKGVKSDQDTEENSEIGTECNKRQEVPIRLNPLNN